MRSRAFTLPALVVATSLTTLTLSGCGMFEKQPPRYNTVSGPRHAPAMNPTGDGLKEFEPREARWMYEYEQDNIRAQKEYPSTREAAEADDYPVEDVPSIPTPDMQPQQAMAAAGAGAEGPSPLYYLEQQGAITGGAPAQLTTAEAAPTMGVASAPMGPAQYEREQPPVPAETLPQDQGGFPHLGDVPEASQNVKDQAQHARQEANQAFAEQPGAIAENSEKRKTLNAEAAENSMIPEPMAEAEMAQPGEVVADVPADSMQSPQQRRMLTSDEVDQAVLPNGLYDQNASPLAQTNNAEAEFHSQLMQESNMPPGSAPALTAPPAAPMVGAQPPAPPPYDVPVGQMQQPAQPAPVQAAPLRPLENVYGAAPVQQPVYNPQVGEPVPVQEYPTVAAQQPLVLTPPSSQGQLTPPSNLQRRAQYLQESRYARMRTAHRAPRHY